MQISRRLALAGAALSTVPARAQEGPSPRRVLAGVSGPYHDAGGPTVVACARQAIEDSGIIGRGIPVEVLAADHQNKADVGMSIARQWFDQGGVDALLDVNN